MPTSTRKPSPYDDAGSEAINATIERVAPSIPELLAEGLPRSKPAIVEALAGRHDRQDVVHALIRLAVTGQVEDRGGKYTLASEPVPDVGQGLACGNAADHAPRAGPPGGDPAQAGRERCAFP